MLTSYVKCKLLLLFHRKINIEVLVVVVLTLHRFF